MIGLLYLNPHVAPLTRIMKLSLLRFARIDCPLLSKHKKINQIENGHVFVHILYTYVNINEPNELLQA